MEEYIYPVGYITSEFHMRSEKSENKETGFPMGFALQPGVLPAAPSPQFESLMNCPCHHRSFSNKPCSFTKGYLNPDWLICVDSTCSSWTIVGRYSNWLSWFIRPTIMRWLKSNTILARYHINIDVQCTRRRFQPPGTKQQHFAFRRVSRIAPTLAQEMGTRSADSKWEDMDWSTVPVVDCLPIHRLLNHMGSSENGDGHVDKHVIHQLILGYSMHVQMKHSRCWSTSMWQNVTHTNPWPCIRSQGTVFQHAPAAEVEYCNYSQEVRWLWWFTLGGTPQKIQGKPWRLPHAAGAPEKWPKTWQFTTMFGPIGLQFCLKSIALVQTYTTLRDPTALNTFSDCIFWVGVWPQIGRRRTPHQTLRAGGVKSYAAV